MPPVLLRAQGRGRARIAVFAARVEDTLQEGVARVVHQRAHRRQHPKVGIVTIDPHGGGVIDVPAQKM